MITLSFRAQLALLHLTVIVVVMTIAAFAGYWSLSKAVHGQLDGALLALAETEMASLSSEQPVRVHEVAPGPAPPSFVRLDRLVQIVDEHGTVLARSANLGDARLPVSPQLLARLAAGETVFETLKSFGEEPVRMVSVPARDAHHAVQVAGSLDDVHHVVSSVSMLFLGLAVALLTTVGLAGAFLTRRVFDAIDDVVQQLRRIGERNLGGRLPHPGKQDEIGRLIDTLNAMLGRLESSFEAQRHFTADAAHELRSPLSRLRAEIEVTLRRPRENADYIDALRSCLGEVERFTQLMEELLLLARLDASQERVQADPVALNPIVAAELQRIEPVARARQVQLTFEPGPPITASVHREHISLVLANVLDNAIKFSPVGGHVRVSMFLAKTDGEDEALIEVADSGPGIDPVELPQLFERFYRGAVARATETPGVGLGLALSRSIVRAYGGRIDATASSDGGALFIVGLPLHA